MSGHRKWSEIRAGAARETGESLRTLTELRLEEGLSQQDMAEELAVSQANISRIERQADPQVSTLMRYLGALGANLELRAVFPDRSVQLYFLESDVGEEAATDGTGSRQQHSVERTAP
jgi:transcriptional regulator with XRE-family HTH domain